MKKVIIIVLLVIVFIIGGVFALYQFTDLFGSKIIPKDIKTITINYYPGYNYDTGSKLNTKDKKVIEEQTIKLTKEQINEAKKYLRRIKEKQLKTKTQLLDRYEVIINDDITIKIDNEDSIMNNKTIQIPKDGVKLFDLYIEDNNKKVLKTIDFKTVLFKLDGSVITVSNKDNIEYIKNSLSYYPITLDNDYKTYNNGYKIEMIFDNKTHLYLYEKTNIAYLTSDDNKGYVVLTDELYSLLEEIYKVSTE